MEEKKNIHHGWMGAEKPNASLLIANAFPAPAIATPTLEIRWSRGIW